MPISNTVNLGVTQNSWQYVLIYQASFDAIDTSGLESSNTQNKLVHFHKYNKKVNSIVNNVNVYTIDNKTLLKHVQARYVAFPLQESFVEGDIKDTVFTAQTNVE